MAATIANPPKCNRLIERSERKTSKKNVKEKLSKQLSKWSQQLCVIYFENSYRLSNNGELQIIFNNCLSVDVGQLQISIAGRRVAERYLTCILISADIKVLPRKLWRLLLSHCWPAGAFSSCGRLKTQRPKEIPLWVWVVVFPCIARQDTMTMRVALSTGSNEDTFG